MIKKIWISNKIFNEWRFYCLTGGIFPSSDRKIKRAYEIWERANSLIVNARNKFDLCDGVLNLKRSLDHRLQLFESLYFLRRVRKTGHYLDVLAYFGIIRPLLFHELLTIRNKIEHEDKNPPKASECERLIDIVWYFLKSTDYWVASHKYQFEITNWRFKYEHSCSIEINWKRNLIRISGWIPKNVVANEPFSNSVPVMVNQFLMTKDFPRRPSEIIKPHKDTDYYFVGEIVEPAAKLMLYKGIFTSYV
jgi:hypothetical protein